MRVSHCSRSLDRKLGMQRAVVVVVERTFRSANLSAPNHAWTWCVLSATAIESVV